MEVEGPFPVIQQFDLGRPDRRIDHCAVERRRGEGDHLRLIHAQNGKPPHGRQRGGDGQHGGGKDHRLSRGQLE